MEAGYFFLELDDVCVALAKAVSGDLKVKADLELTNGGDIVKWSNNNNALFTTDTVSAFLQESETPASVDADGQELPAVVTYKYTVGFGGLKLKANYVDLTNDAVATLAQAILNIKIFNADEAAAASNVAAAVAPPAKGKGAAAAPASTAPAVAPADAYLFNIQVPLSALLKSSGGILQPSLTAPTLAALTQNAAFTDLIVKLGSDSSGNGSSNLLTADTTVTWRLTADNDLAEYVMGCSVLQWEELVLAAPPATWSVHYNDVIDPKAKVPATAAELRAKYLENIIRLVAAQSTAVAAYTAQIGSPATAEDSGSVIPFTRITGGTIAFNAALAAEIPVDEDIRARTDLWSVSWPRSTPFFVHRKQKRELLQAIAEGSSQITVTLTKTPTAEGAALEGTSPVTITGSVDVSSIARPGLTRAAPLEVTLAQLEDGSANSGSASLALILSEPLQPSAILPGGAGNDSNVKRRPADVVSQRQVSTYDTNRNVVEELQTEIAAVIKQIANEYMLKYPPSSSSQQPNSLAERKAEFLHFLSTSGLYHGLKERLKPRIQRIVCERYGNRAKALGRSDLVSSGNLHGTTINSTGTLGGVGAETTDMDALLGEMYVYLTKQCNLVLNTLYTSTLIQRDVAELEVSRTIDDEVETPRQKYQRLLVEALDAEADGRYPVTDSIHLERIQFVHRESAFATDPDAVHDVYARYGESCLRIAAKYATLRLPPASLPTQQSQQRQQDDEAFAKTLLEKGREALSISYANDRSDVSVALLYVAVLIEFDQLIAVETALKEILAAILDGDSSKGGLTSMNDFDGYQSDRLVPVDPNYYALLAVYFQLISRPRSARKAMLLANRSYVESDVQPPASQHGVPRRTLVYLLSKACTMFATFGLSRTAEQLQLLAASSEAAVQAKTSARNLPTATVPFIRHALKAATSLQHLVRGCRRDISAELPTDSEVRSALSAALDAAHESVMAATDVSDKIAGWLLVARAQSSLHASAAVVLDAYSQATVLAFAGPIAAIPLDAYLTLGKLLIASSRVKEAYAVLLTACNAYTSSALLTLIGVSCLRLDKPVDAEDALREANLLDCRNPEVWAYLSLACLAQGRTRLEEAEKASRQALRLSLGSPALLRELATSYMSVDRLATAEEHIRRAMALEMAATAETTGRANPVTRKLFADVLAGQNQAVLAVQEYQALLADDATDINTRKIAADRCLSLLSSLGRFEEIKTLKKIKESL